MPQGRRRRFGPIVAKPSITLSPFLKWAGGKAQLLAQMEEYIPDEFETYFEPFLGGGAVFFHLTPERAVLGDLNAEIINAYDVVRSDTELLIEELGGHEAHKASEEYYYRIRKQRPYSLDKVVRAARTIFLNKTCYNGLYRVNSKGEFNVPFGRYKNPQLYKRENLLACSKALQGKLITVGVYQDVLAYAREGDFVYLDPPYYPVSVTASFTSYTKDAFSEKDQRRLAAVFDDLDAKGCKVMLSNSATKLIRELYAGHSIKVLKAKRAISSKAETRGAIDELLIVNYEV